MAYKIFFSQFYLPRHCKSRTEAAISRSLLLLTLRKNRKKNIQIFFYERALKGFQPTEEEI